MFSNKLDRLMIAVLTLVVLLGPLTCWTNSCWQNAQSEIAPLQIQVADGTDPRPPFPPSPRPWNAGTLGV